MLKESQGGTWPLAEIKLRRLLGLKHVGQKTEFLELQNNVLTVKRNANYARMFAGTSRCDGEEQRRGISVRVLHLGSKLNFKFPWNETCMYFIKT